MEGAVSFFFFRRLSGCLDRVINVLRFDRNRSMPVSHSQQTVELLSQEKTLLLY